MSCSWDLICVDCSGARAGLDFNHGGDQIAAMLEFREPMAAVWGGTRQLWAFFCGPQSRFEQCAEFLAAHREHNLAVISEYGEVWGACSKRVECACGQMRYCTFVKDHYGECSPKVMPRHTL